MSKRRQKLDIKLQKRKNHYTHRPKSTRARRVYVIPYPARAISLLLKIVRDAEVPNSCVKIISKLRTSKIFHIISRGCVHYDKLGFKTFGHERFWTILRNVLRESERKIQFFIPRLLFWRARFHLMHLQRENNYSLCMKCNPSPPGFEYACARR